MFIRQARLPRGAYDQERTLLQSVGHFKRMAVGNKKMESVPEEEVLRIGRKAYTLIQTKGMWAKDLTDFEYSCMHFYMRKNKIRR